MNKEIVLKQRAGIYITFFGLMGISIILVMCVFYLVLNNDYDRVFGLILCTFFLIYETYYLSISLTTIRMNSDGCFIKRAFRQKFHSWDEFKIIYHYRIKDHLYHKGEYNDVVLFSVEELKNKKAKKRTLSYVYFKNKFNVMCIELYTREKIKRKFGRFDTIWYEREEFLETLGQWGIKIESDCEDLTKYYIPKKEDHIVQLVDGIFIKKIQKNQWKIVTALFEHIIEYNENKNELFIDGIKRSFLENSIVRFIGIDEEFQIDDKNIRIIVRNKKMRIVHKGKYVDINEPYIPLKAERMIYFVIPFPVILASIGALKEIQELFVISFAILIVLYTYVVKAIKIYNTEQ